MILATLFSFLFHEFGHYLFGMLSGERMYMTLNSCDVIGGVYTNPSNEITVLWGGPIFSIIQGIAFSIILIKQKKELLFPFVFMAFITNLVSLFINFFHPQDGAKLGLHYGVGYWTLPALFFIILFTCIYFTHTKNKLTFSFQLKNFVISVVITVIVVLIDSI